MATAVAGFLRKSSGNKKGFRKRYFALKGFHVYYYSDDPAHGSTVRGHFDLRNVVQIVEVDSSVAPNAIQLCIAEGETSRVKKTITLSFDTEPSKRDAWLDALCSAISTEFVGPGLHHHHLPPLASEFNSRFGQQRGVGSRRSLLSGKAPITAPLTPRGQPPRRSTASSSTASLTYEIVVPTGAVPGDKLKMQLPSGEEVVVMVPPETTSGSVLTFAMPNAINGGTHDDKGAEENDVDAVILIQAAVRGKLARRRASAAPFAPEQEAVTHDNKLASPGILGRLKSYAWTPAEESEKIADVVLIVFRSSQAFSRIKLASRVQRVGLLCLARLPARV